MTPDESDPLFRVMRALSHFTLIKRELRWLEREEPEEFKRLLAKLKEAISGPD